MKKAMIGQEAIGNGVIIGTQQHMVMIALTTVLSQMIWRIEDYEYLASLSVEMPACR